MNTKEILNDEYISQFIRENKLNGQQIESSLGSFLNVYYSRRLCEGCKGIEECRQKAAGERFVLSYNDVVFEEIEYCKYGLPEYNKSRLASRYLYCDVPKNLLNVFLNDVKYTEDQKGLYLELAKILHKKSEKGLYISGDLGTGKTYLCIALANSLVLNDERVAFVKVNNFFNEMKSYFNGDSSMVDKNINKLKNADYLILDDIGAEAVSEFVRDDVLFPILDYRLENKKMTIFTSNLNREELLRHYQYDRKEKSNLMNAKRLLERIDILTDDFVLTGKNMRRVV